MKKSYLIKIFGIAIPLCILAVGQFIDKNQATCMFKPRHGVLAQNLLTSRNAHHTIVGECEGKMFLTIVNDTKNTLTVSSTKGNKTIDINKIDKYFVQADDTILLKQDDKVSTINIEKFSATGKK